MKLRHLIALGVAGCAGYAAYHVYKNRDQFKAEIAEADDISERISTDIVKFVAVLTTLTTSFQHFKQSAKIWITNVAFLNKKPIAA